jgi:phage tail sheath protein FI
MGQYLSPGVYVEEVPPLARPIAGVGTSTPAFIGVIADKINLPVRPLSGQTDSAWVEFTIPSKSNEAVFVSSWNQYVKLFGDFVGGNTAPANIAVVTEGAAATLKTYVTGTTDANLTVTISYSSKTATGVSDSSGKFKIVVDNSTTIANVKATTTDSGPHSIASGQRRLAHAVYGFFNNGGSGCYVIRITAETDIQNALAKLAAIDVISMVAAPGMTSATVFAALEAHCENLQDRVAILDSVEEDSKFNTGDYSDLATSKRPQNSTYSAFYFPWLQVSDPAESLANPNGNGLVYVPPSGHIAGIYARTDNTRGVFKAPANEALLGVTGLKYQLTKSDQDQLNGVGVNLIRPLVGAFRVWGARTVGGDANGEFRYISTRRYMNYLRESIEEGTQFVVFEPNSPALWERIKRTVGGFLMNEWRSGALFGTTPDKAFFVKCDADTNPPEERAAGRVITEIGVAIVQPAEFVIFRIQQQAGS